MLPGLESYVSLQESRVWDGRKIYIYRELIRGFREEYYDTEDAQEG